MQLANLHPQIKEQLATLENNRRELLATSSYASRTESIIEDSFPASDVNFFIDPLSLYVAIRYIKRFDEMTPLLRALRQEGWVIETQYQRNADDDGWDTIRVRKDAEGFHWTLKYEIRDDLQIGLSLNALVDTAENSDGDSCVRVKIGEKKVERIQEIFEVICPGGYDASS
jgi:hypothetical protein